MPANERDVKAEMELQGGEESGTAEPGCEVTNVMDEMEMRVAKMSGNDRVRTAELELPGGEGGSQAEPGDVSQHDGDRVKLEEVQSEFSDRLNESGTAELEDDQFPHPIQHQSKTQ